MLRIFSLAVMLLSSTSLAQADGGVFAFPLGSTTSPFGYLAYFPPGYSASGGQQYPLVVFLHGLGEIGNGTTQLQNVKNAGPIRQIERVPTDRTYFETQRAIVIHPQAPDQWMFNPQLPNMTVFFQYLFNTYPVDRSRVYLTGLSSGGGGVYTFVGDGRAHGVLAAIIPVCGNNEAYTSFLPHFRDLPMWSFQNWGDSTNPRSRAINFTTGAGRQRTGSTTLNVMSNYPHNAGDVNQPASSMLTAVLTGSNTFSWVSGHGIGTASDLRLTLGTSNSHDAWSDAYSDRNVWDWLFSHTLDGGYLVFDAGGPVDAGVRVDAGSDAGIRIDAGTDAGIRVDAGTDAGIRLDAGQFDGGTPSDAGLSVDAGAMTDAGPSNTDGGAGFFPDSGTDVDAGSQNDAGAEFDAGEPLVNDAGPAANPNDVGLVSDAGSETPMNPQGCNCTTGAEGPGVAALLLLLRALRRRK